MSTARSPATRPPPLRPPHVPVADTQQQPSASFLTAFGRAVFLPGKCPKVSGDAPGTLTVFSFKCYEPEANTGGEESAPLLRGLEESGSSEGALAMLSHLTWNSPTSP